MCNITLYHTSIISSRIGTYVYHTSICTILLVPYTYVPYFYLSHLSCSCVLFLFLSLPHNKCVPFVKELVFFFVCFFLFVPLSLSLFVALLIAFFVCLYLLSFAVAGTFVFIFIIKQQSQREVRERENPERRES